MNENNINNTNNIQEDSTSNQAPKAQQFNYGTPQADSAPPQFNQGYQMPQKTKKPIYKKWWFWVIIVFVLLIIISSFGGNDDSDTSTSDSSNSISTSEATTKETTTKETTTEIPSMSKEELEESCKEIPYKDLARDPDNYKGELVKFTGEVVQVIESSFGANEYRVAVTKDEYGYYDYDNIIYLTYSLKDGESRILEDDIIVFYGTYTGLTSYTSTLGGKITIPAVDGEYVKIDD